MNVYIYIYIYTYRYKCMNHDIYIYIYVKIDMLARYTMCFRIDDKVRTSICNT